MAAPQKTLSQAALEYLITSTTNEPVGLEIWNAINTALNSGGGGGGAAIGAPVSGSTARSILYTSVSNVLWEDVDFTRDSISGTTIIRSFVSADTNVKLDVNNDLPAVFISSHNSATSINNIVGVGDFSGLGFDANTSLFFYKNNISGELSFAAAGTTNFSIIYNNGVGHQSYLGLYGASFNLAFTDGANNSGISGSGVAFHITNNNVQWFWPTADSTTPNQPMVSDGGGTLGWGPRLDYGVYSYSTTLGTNAASFTGYTMIWSRIGNTLTASGKIDVTASGAGLTQFILSMPTGLPFSLSTQAYGTMTTSEASPLVGTIQAHVGGALELNYNAIDSASHTFFFNFSYQVQ